MQENFPKKPFHKQVYSNHAGERFIYSRKSKKWYTFSEKDEFALGNKSGTKWWKWGVGAILVLLVFSALADDENSNTRSKSSDKPFVSSQYVGPEKVVDASNTDNKQGVGINVDPLSETLIKEVLGENVRSATFHGGTWSIQNNCIPSSSCITFVGEYLTKLGKLISERSDIQVPSKGIAIHSYVPAIDRYGNKSNSLAFTLLLSGTDIKNANWDNMEHLLTLDLSKVIEIRPLFKKSAFEYCFQDGWLLPKAAELIPNFCNQVRLR